jgi:hypothetical protein
VSSSTWTFRRPEERAWWGQLWADRILESEFATQGLEYGLTTKDELDVLSQAFRDWADEEDGVFVVVNYEVVAQRGAS